VQKPSVGRIVHYRNFGTPGELVCRAAVVTTVDVDGTVGLAVLQPVGASFSVGHEQDETSKAYGTWHWPERIEGDS